MKIFVANSAKEEGEGGSENNEENPLRQDTFVDDPLINYVFY